MALFASGAEWTKLGDARAGAADDRDEIGVKTSDTFYWIKFRIADRTVRFREITIEYDGGQRQTLKMVPGTVPPGTTIGPYKLSEKRAIHAVLLHYETKLTGLTRAKVEVFAR